MKKYIFLAQILLSVKAFSQKINFTSDSIFIDSKACFRFLKSNDTFSIQTLDDKKIIEWQVQSLGSGRFSTTYFFSTIDRQFHRDDINGRNAIIFFLVQKGFIENCELNEKKLIRYIDDNK